MLRNFQVAQDISSGWMLGFSLSKTSGLKSSIQINLNDILSSLSC